MFNFDFSKRHQIYSWLDSQLDRSDRSNDANLLSLTNKQLFILVEDYFNIYEFRAEDLKTFVFPIRFCADFMKKFHMLAISFESVFDTFMKIYRNLPVHNSEHVKQLPAYPHDGEDDNDNEDNVDDDEVYIDEYNSNIVMQRFASFMKRYIDSGLLDKCEDAHHRLYPWGTFDYFKENFPTSSPRTISAIPEIMLELWYTQCIEPDINTSELLWELDTEQYDAFNDFKRFFNNCIDEQIITSSNYKLLTTFRTIHQSFQEYLSTSQYSSDPQSMHAILDSISTMYLILTHATFKPILYSLSDQSTNDYY